MLNSTGRAPPSGEHFRTPASSSGPIYPTSGAFQHLPARRTLSGSIALAHPNANKIFLRNLPSHCYALPNVPLNFTILEIIVLLPNWFKNKALAARFMNNDITAPVHFMMLEQHREMKFATEAEKDKAPKTLTDEYRKAMRKAVGSSWTKAKHAAPLGWDPLLLAMDGFVPDDARLPSYRRPASIPFRDLMVGVKKLPEGDHAGDLTRALYFAQQQEVDYMFPDDLPNILDIVGRTEITTAHNDRLIVRHYAALKDSVKKSLPKKGWKSRPGVDEMVARVDTEQPPLNGRDQIHVAMTMPQHTGWLLGPSSWEVDDQPSLAEQWHLERATAIAQPSTQGLSSQVWAETFAEPSRGLSTPNLPPQVNPGMADSQAIAKLQDIAAQESIEEMDALMREHQGQAYKFTTPASPRYHPRQLLRECIEGTIGFDGTALAKAARFAQQPDQLTIDWYVENVPWLSQLLEATRGD